MKLNFVDFKKIASIICNPLSPKGQDELLVEYVVEIDNEDFVIRSFAPNNYRQVWIKLPKRYYKELKQRAKQNNFLTNFLVDGWFRIASHDSCWGEGFDLKEYTNWNEKEIHFKRILVREIVKTDKWENEVSLDLPKDIIADDLPLIKGTTLAHMDYFNGVSTLLDFISKDKQLVARFTNKEDYDCKDVEVMVEKSYFKQYFPMPDTPSTYHVGVDLREFLTKYFGTEINNIQLFDLT